MAISNVALFGAAFFTPVVVGKITQSLGFHWPFFFVAIFLAIMLPFMVLFVPEPAFRRPDYLNTDFQHKDQGSTDSQLPLETAHDEAKAFSSAPVEAFNGTSRTEVSQPIPEKDSFFKSLRLFNGRKTDENFFKLLVRPFPLFLHPSIIWVSTNPE